MEGGGWGNPGYGAPLAAGAHHGGGGGGGAPRRGGGGRGRRGHPYQGQPGSYHRHRHPADEAREALPQPKSPEEEALERLVTMLFRKLSPAPASGAGDDGMDTGGTPSAIATTLGQALELMVPVLEREFDQGRKEQILEALALSITSVPGKTHLYALLTGLINAKSFDLTAEIVAKACSLLLSTIAVGDMLKARLALRYLVELANVNVVFPTEVITLYELMLNEALGEEAPAPSLDAAQRDAVVYLVLSSLPYVCELLARQVPEDLSRIFATVQAYMEARNTLPAYDILRPLRLDPAALSMGQAEGQSTAATDEVVMDELELLYSQLFECQANGWEVPLLDRQLVEAYDATLQVGIQHEFNLESVLGGGDAAATTMPLRLHATPRLWIFTDTVNCPDNQLAHLPPTLDVGRHVLEVVAGDLLTTFAMNHLEGSTQLLQLEHLFSRAHLSTHGYQVLESVVETLFRQLLALPSSREKGVYYATLLMDLIRADKRVPSMMGRIVRILFGKLDAGPEGSAPAYGMDVELIRRLVDWFSLHLSNFSYFWKWADWEGCLARPASGQYVFVVEVLFKCIRLSYYERISTLVPPAYLEHLPRPAFSFRYATLESCGDEALFALAQKLQSSFFSRGTEGGEAALDSVLADIRLRAVELVSAPASKGEGEAGDEPSTASMGLMEEARAWYQDKDFHLVARDVFLQCLMHQGSKSFSHLLTAIERTLPYLVKLHGTAEEKHASIGIVAEFWAGHPQFLEIILEKLENYRILDHTTIVAWCFEPGNLDANYARPHLWSILETTLKKVNLKVAVLQGRIAEAEARALAGASAPEPPVHGEESGAAKEGPETLDAMRSTLALMKRERKEVFLLTFQKFNHVLTAHATACASEDQDPEATFWWRWVSGHMCAIGRAFHAHLAPLVGAMDSLVFAGASGRVDERVAALWAQLKVFYAAQK